MATIIVPTLIALFIYTLIVTLPSWRALRSAAIFVGVPFALLWIGILGFSARMDGSPDHASWAGIFLLVPLFTIGLLAVPALAGFITRAISLSLASQERGKAAAIVNCAGFPFAAGILYLSFFANELSKRPIDSDCAAAVHTVAIDDIQLRIRTDAPASLDFDQSQGFSDRSSLENGAIPQRQLCSLSRSGRRDVRVVRISLKESSMAGGCGGAEPGSGQECRLPKLHAGMPELPADLPSQVTITSLGQRLANSKKSTYQVSLQANFPKEFVYVVTPHKNDFGEPLTFHCHLFGENKRIADCDTTYRFTRNTIVEYRFVAYADDVAARGIRVDAGLRAYLQYARPDATR